MESLGGTQMDGAKFAKFCRDNRLTDNKKVMSTDVDIIFNKVKAKGSRKLDWNTFQDALALIAEKKHPGKSGEEAFQLLVNNLVRKGTGPISTGTVPQHDAIVDRMTDTSLYTGTHKLRFDESGVGLGAAGRDQPSRTADLSQLTNREETSVRGLPVSIDPNAGAERATTGKRSHQVTASTERLDQIASKPKKTNTTTSPAGSRTNLSGTGGGSRSNLTSTGGGSRSNLTGGSPTKKPTTAGKQYKATSSSGGGGASVFDRLTNTSGYTGTHKERFDAQGQGRGLAGRDSPAKGASPGQYRGGDVKDLSQILRT